MARRRDSGWGAVSLCLFTACQGLVNFERAPAQRDAGSEVQTQGNLRPEGPLDAALTPADSAAPVAPVADEGTPDPCAPNPALDVRESCCAAYCELFFRICSDLPAVGSYTSSLDCANKCYSSSGWPIGTIREVGSIACRNYHSTLAEDIPSLRETHCGHAGEVPAPGGC